MHHQSRSSIVVRHILLAVLVSIMIADRVCTLWMMIASIMIPVVLDGTPTI